jgi:general secretion pathway protein J
MKRNNERDNGFTLVELLVAISILAMVAVLGWRGLDGIVRARVALGEQMETTRGMQLAFAQMQSDAEHIAGEDVLDKRPFLLTDDNRLTLVRTVFRENEPSHLQVVAYRVVDGMLLRRESPATRDLIQLDALWRSATSDADTTPPVNLQAGVVGMQLMSWYGGAWHPELPPANTVAAGAVPAGMAAPTVPVTGLQVALQVQGQQMPMSKAFLLGGP